MRKLTIESLENRALLSATVPVLPATHDDIPAQVSPQAATTRDAADWPFASDSPWNTSLGSGANYANVTSAGFDPNGGLNLNVRSWSHPVFVASPSDPLTDFYRNDTGLIATIRAPSDAAPDPQADGSLIIVDATGSTPYAVEMWQASWSGGAWRASATALHDLTGMGFYDEYVGVRAGGMSALGGLIRRDELINLNIPHALAIAVSSSAMNRNVPGTSDAWTWPASWADGFTNPGSGYGTVGNLHMGSLLAIPPSVDINVLGLSPQGKAIARAMQDYGAYITEQASANLVVYVEPAASGILNTSSGELGTLTQYLHAITNNGPNSVGGGGVARRDPAPPISGVILEPDPDPQPDPQVDYVVAGIVTADGAPLAGAKMHLALPDWPSFRVAYTDGSGQYSFENVASGDYVMGVWTSAYAWSETNFTVSGSNATVHFALGRAPQPDPDPDPDPQPDPQPDPGPVQVFAISGTLQLVRGRRPIENAQVHLLDSDGQYLQTVWTDSNGRYQFESIERGEYTIRIEPEGYGWTEKEFTLEGEDESLDFRWHPRHGWR